MNSNFSNSPIGQVVLIVAGIFSAIALTSCSTVTADQYEATARTTYTWQVKYSIDPSSDKLPRFETFTSTNVLNRNGLKPEEAVTGPDDRGLWWPALPPRPTVDEVEQRQRPQEKASTPELLKAVEYQLTYKVGDKQRTLPTNYQVYRQVVKTYPQRTPLQLTLGVNDNSVEKAEPVTQ
jgi:hypothetical protein